MNKNINDTKSLVVDSAYMPRSIIDVTRAFVIYFKGNAEIVHNYPTHFNTVNKEVIYPKPSIIRVFRYVNVGYEKVPLTRKNVFRRDNHQCVYCESGDKSKLTLDHVVPQSRGGKDTWNNLVTCCYDCNQAKADLSVEEWGKPEPRPLRPHYLMLIKEIHDIPDEWKDYLFY